MRADKKGRQTDSRTVVSFVSVPIIDLLWIWKGETVRVQKKNPSGLHPGRCGRIFVWGVGGGVGGGLLELKEFSHKQQLYSLELFGLFESKTWTMIQHFEKGNVRKKMNACWLSVDNILLKKKG